MLVQKRFDFAPLLFVIRHEAFQITGYRKEAAVSVDMLLSDILPGEGFNPLNDFRPASDSLVDQLLLSELLGIRSSTGIEGIVIEVRTDIITLINFRAIYF
ncbi:hypothetical protein [Paenibacillus spongiae]|uniref:Uncharacterized protein n=1 Tax=Paenibacillus spongiae TaxID=2909671 RepID=A0ABY5SG02_9BACL|nr:hypothetical protein [Paenibacillus spongiae]UVI32483.1 hypothetical protein L1F29_11940 [Paenibacillus spongiae]